jgi:hypothetical protein
MEIHFLWNPVQFAWAHDGHLERPLLATLLEEQAQILQGKSRKFQLKFLATKIASRKNFSPENMLIWLSGPWLASTSELLQVSPFKLRAAELVQGYFFEPAIVVHNDTNRPYLGTGLARVKRVKGSYRIVLHRHNVDRTIWWLIGAGEPPLPTTVNASFSKSFSDIEYSLSHCEQACLATEPVLAVCLSISHDFAVESFQPTFSKLWQETLPQRTCGRVDGELNEYAVFAALQLACRTYTYPTTLSVRAMLTKLRSLLLVEPVVPPVGLIELASENQILLQRPAVRTTLTISVGEVSGDEKNPEFHPTIDDRIDTALETMMPWLVPACSREILKNTVGRAGAELFDDAMIAGLVPGATNSPFDAYAYGWAEEASLQWAFEFKARSEYYNEAEAILSLNAKCATYRREEQKKGRIPEKHHAMLVGITGAGPTKVLVWRVDDQLRIVMLVNGMA